MLLKRADDKTKRMALLKDLQQSPCLDSSQRKWLAEELSNLAKEMTGERKAAYYLDSYFKESPNHMVLHDLRLMVQGEVVQIDHLVIGRAFIYLVETKNWTCNVWINDHGEFTVEYGNHSRFGVASPIEQSHRHERALRAVLDQLGFKSRFGTAVDIRNVVMFHPQAIIHRPDAKAFDTSMVIKADAFPSWINRFVERELGVGATLKALATLRGQDTIAEWGKALMRCHQPVDLLALPDFMRPQSPPVPAPVSYEAAPAPARRKVQEPAAAVTRRPSPRSRQPEARHAPPPDSQVPMPYAVPGEKKCICAHCGCKISYEEGMYCWHQSQRFHGQQFCREHQKLFPFASREAVR